MFLQIKFKHFEIRPKEKLVPFLILASLFNFFFQLSFSIKTISICIFIDQTIKQFLLILIFFRSLCINTWITEFLQMGQRYKVTAKCNWSSALFEIESEKLLGYDRTTFMDKSVDFCAFTDNGRVMQAADCK